MEDLDAVIRFHPDVLVIGQGKYGIMAVDETVMEALSCEGIDVVVAKTDRAVEEFNRLSKRRRVVGTFHLTC